MYVCSALTISRVERISGCIKINVSWRVFVASFVREVFYTWREMFLLFMEVGADLQEKKRQIYVL